MRACAACLRRTALLRDLGPAIEGRFRGRRPTGLLTLDDAALIRAVANREDAVAVRARTASDAELQERSARDARERGVTGICRHDDAYPAKLRDLADPPAVLHVVGGPERLDRALGADGRRPTVAIVGARRAPADARALAERFAGALAAAGVGVISGLAFGIDAAAHVGALAAGNEVGATGGPTVAVLAGGPDRASPARHRALHARIAGSGLVVSEMAPGTTPRPWSFPARNRVIAALADVTVVIAAAARSGSLSTARFALDLDRPLGVVPGAVDAPAFAGSNRLLRDEPGAAVVLEPDDIRLLLGDRASAQGIVALPARDPLAGLAGEARRLAASVLAGARTVEQLASEYGADEVLRGLADLEAQGRLRRELDGRLTVIPGTRFGIADAPSSPRSDR